MRFGSNSSDDRAVFLEGKKRVVVCLDAAGDELRISERPRGVVRLVRSGSRTFALREDDRVSGAGSRVAVECADGRSLALDAPSEDAAAVWRARLREKCRGRASVGRHRRRESFFLGGGAPPSPDSSVRHEFLDGEFSSASSLSDVEGSPDASPVARRVEINRRMARASSLCGLGRINQRMARAMDWVASTPRQRRGSSGGHVANRGDDVTGL